MKKLDGAKHKDHAILAENELNQDVHSTPGQIVWGRILLGKLYVLDFCVSVFFASSDVLILVHLFTTRPKFLREKLRHTVGSFIDHSYSLINIVGP